ncbi:MAG: UPF0262 family protein [Alphaproteobacteria bacterium]|nr:UPF0262 family protein [Alphaproteobacteria bacterium]
MKPLSDNNHRIVHVAIDNPSIIRYQPDVEREIDVAVYDLVETNSFQPDPAFFGGAPHGPYDVTLRIQESRLVFDIDRQDGVKVGAVMFSVQSLRRTIRDYFTVCESYYEAIRSASPAQIEAIDVGRRALHNEGSERLQSQLAGKVDVDFDTARRLFTLICALHIRA